MTAFIEAYGTQGAKMTVSFSWNRIEDAAGKICWRA